MFKFFSFFLLLPLLYADNVCAQYNNDAQLWQNIYIEKNITRRFLVHINEQGRLTENLSIPSYIYADLGLTYKVSKHIHLSLAYVPIAKRLNVDFVSFRHQFYFNFVLKYKYRHFVFYDRQMIQNQYNDINRSANWNIPNYYLRNKITIKYNSDTRFTPYIAEEQYFDWNDNHRNGMQFDKGRYFAGCFYEINLLDVFELYYLIEKHFNITQPFTNYVIGIGYSHVFY